LLAATFGFLAQRHVNGGSAGADVLGTQRIDFSLPDLKGDARRLSEWDGKVLVVNFWATWCPPCRKEIPDFVKLQTEYATQGVQFVGVAMDRVEDVRDFIRHVPMNYPVLIGDEEGDISRRYGNKFAALPYTVIIDRAGRVVLTRRGLLPPAEVKATLGPLL
jgi:peroxiredoxin